LGRSIGASSGASTGCASTLFCGGDCVLDETFSVSRLSEEVREELDGLEE
jgi:hypothetical protein